MKLIWKFNLVLLGIFLVGFAIAGYISHTVLQKNAREEVNKRIDAFVEKGKPVMPAEVKFTTYTLRYNQCAWVRIDGIEKHWERATVIGKDEDGTFDVRTEGVTALTVTLTGDFPKGAGFTVVIDG